MSDRMLGLIVCLILGLFTAILAFAFLVPFLEHRPALYWSAALGLVAVLGLLFTMGARDA